MEDQIKPDKNDQVFILGDLIDKGRDSRMVLEYIYSLKSEGYRVYPIRGNHEDMILTAYDCGFGFFENYLQEYNATDLLDGDVHQYLQFISTFDYCIELDDYVLCHPGINDDRINPYTDLRGMFSRVNFDYDFNSVQSKTQIHGHISRTIGQITESVENNDKRISIDAGCVVEEDELGVLVALDLDSKELFLQKNMEPAYVEVEDFDVSCQIFNEEE